MSPWAIFWLTIGLVFGAMSDAFGYHAEQRRKRSKWERL